MTDTASGSEPTPGVTRYAGMSRLRVLLVLGAMFLCIAWGLATAPRDTLVPESYKGEDQSDLALYQKIVKRLQSGQGYYDAMGAELRAGGRATRSVFNWRTPLHLYLVAFVPFSNWVLGLAALLATGLSFVILQREGLSVAAAFQALLIFGAFLGCFTPPGVYFAEMWAGALIVLSFGAYAFGRWRAGVVLGMLALFCRELALPYVMVCAVLAWRARRRQEMIAWLAGLGAYAVYLGLHMLAASSHILPGDIGNPVGWVQFGGLNFLLRVSSVGWLMLLPPWVTALYFSLALLGSGGWMNTAGNRMAWTVTAYTAIFAVVGHSINLYWGAVYAPLLTFGVALSGLALRDCGAAVARRALPRPA